MADTEGRESRSRQEDSLPLNQKQPGLSPMLPRDFMFEATVAGSKLFEVTHCDLKPGTRRNAVPTLLPILNEAIVPPSLDSFYSPARPSPSHGRYPFSRMVRYVISNASGNT